MPSFFFLLLFFPFLTNAADPKPEPDGLHMELFRAPPDPTRTNLDRIRDIVLSDQARLRLRRGIGSDSAAPAPAPNAFEMPVRSGAYTGTGQYFVRVRIGTPAQTFLLVADTGSDLTWVNCKYKTAGSDTEGDKPIFWADRSRTFRPISCSDEMCRDDLPFSPATCPTPASLCTYTYGYVDGSVTEGFYANESVTIGLSNGHKQKLKGLLIGCTSNSPGASFRSSDGVLGLGNSDISFASRAADRFGGKFSYCLVDHLSPKNASGYLIFGPNRSLLPLAAQETELLIEPKLEPFYAAAVIGFSVDGEVLKIPRSVWNVSRGGGAILDSGSSLTILAEPAYEPVVTALSRRLRGVPMIAQDPFEFCYNWTDAGDVTVPKLVMHFAGQARLEPPAKSYLIDVAAGVKCIGLQSVSWPSVSTIGNILQQDHLWEFDIPNQRLRFQPSTCGK